MIPVCETRCRGDTPTTDILEFVAIESPSTTFPPLPIADPRERPATSSDSDRREQYVVEAQRTQEVHDPET